jgi:PAS domain S-box-containing protein
VKSPVFDSAGKIVGTQGVLFDVTERKRAEEALWEAGERFQLVARATNDAVWDWNLTDPAWWNDTFYEVYGFDRNTPPSFEAWASHIHPDDRERVMAGFRAVVEHGEPAWSAEFRFKRADGTYGHVFDRAYSLRDASGKTVRMLGSMMDITERKRAEEALRTSEAELRAILESTGDGILAVDCEGDKVIKVNRRFAELWKIPQSIMDAGDNDALRNFVLKQLSDPDAFLKKLHSLYGTDAVSVDPLVFKDDRIVERHGFPMIMDGVVTGRVWSFRDITERKRQEEELKQKNAELERFTYTVSHDLKSPLVTVKTFLGYLEQDLTRPDPERVKQDVAYMHTATEKMGQLLDELLNLARVGRKENPSARVTFQELAQEAVRLVAGRISAGGVKVQVADAVVTLEGDRPRLMEIWQNLVENACKFMGNQPQPQVKIGVEPRGPETVFFVRDNGAGIDPRYQSKVFGLFEKLDPKGEGTGMGLALVKRIVEMHKGRIWVESPGLGQGANFLFTLPGAVILDPEQSS